MLDWTMHKAAGLVLCTRYNFWTAKGWIVRIRDREKTALVEFSPKLHSSLRPCLFALGVGDLLGANNLQISGQSRRYGERTIHTASQ